MKVYGSGFITVKVYGNGFISRSFPEISRDTNVLYSSSTYRATKSSEKLMAQKPFPTIQVASKAGLDGSLGRGTEASSCCWVSLLPVLPTLPSSPALALKISDNADQNFSGTAGSAIHPTFACPTNRFPSPGT